VGLLPDSRTTEGPGCPDAGKPVRFNPFEEKPAVQEEEPHEDRHHQVHADVMPEAPEDDLALDSEHEEHEREDETVIPVPESGIIFPERIDPGKKREQRHEDNHDERDKADARRFSHGAVRLTRGIPVRDHLIGEHRIGDERDEEGEDEAGDDCQPDEVHAGSWVSMGNEEWGGAGTGVSRERGLGLGISVDGGL